MQESLQDVMEGVTTKNITDKIAKEGMFQQLDAGIWHPGILKEAKMLKANGTLENWSSHSYSRTRYSDAENAIIEKITKSFQDKTNETEIAVSILRALAEKGFHRTLGGVFTKLFKLRTSPAFVTRNSEDTDEFLSSSF